MMCDTCEKCLAVAHVKINAMADYEGNIDKHNIIAHGHVCRACLLKVTNAMGFQEEQWQAVQDSPLHPLEDFNPFESLED